MRYSDAVIETVRTNNERAIKLSRKLADDLQHNQQEAIALSKKVLDAPTAYSSNLTGAVEAMLNAQSRAVAFAQAAYEQTMEAASQTTETFVQVNRQLADTAIEVTRNLSDEAEKQAEKANRSSN